MQSLPHANLLQKQVGSMRHSQTVSHGYVGESDALLLYQALFSLVSYSTLNRNHTE